MKYVTVLQLFPFQMLLKSFVLFVNEFWPSLHPKQQMFFFSVTEPSGPKPDCSGTLTLKEICDAASFDISIILLKHHLLIKAYIYEQEYWKKTNTHSFIYRFELVPWVIVESLWVRKKTTVRVNLSYYYYYY